MQTKYPSFVFNNESFIIIPGHLFKKDDLKSRLNMMGVDANNIQSKTSLIDLYNSSLKKDENKIKILSKLRIDTDNMNTKLSNSQRQSVPPNLWMNPSKNKIVNISCEVKPYNSKEQQINIIKPIHTNKGQYSQNPFISTNSNQIQNNNNIINYGYSGSVPSFSLNKSNVYESNNSNINDTYNNNFDNSSYINKNNNSSFNNIQELNLKKNYDNSIVSNNSKISNQKNNEEINRESNKTENNRIGIKQFEEDLDNSNKANINNHSSFNIPNNSEFGKKFEEDKINNSNSKQYSYQDEKYKNYINNKNSNNFGVNNNINNNNQSINDENYNYNSNINKDNDAGRRKRLINNNFLTGNDYNLNDNFYNNKKNTYQENINFNNSNLDINNNDSRKTYTNMPNKSQNQYFQNNQSIYDSNNNLNNINTTTPGFNNSAINNSNNNLASSNYNNEKKEKIGAHGQPFFSNEENSIEVNNPETDQDNISNFSFFSDFKKNPFYKNRKFILLHTLALIFILCLAIGILHLISYSWNSITDFFSGFFDLLTNPSRLLEVIDSFFSSIFSGAKNYYYITIPLIIFIFFGFLYFRRRSFKKRIEKIFLQIMQDLTNNNCDLEGINAISEDDIYEKYVKKYGVSYNKFIRKYLPALEKLRMKQNGKIIKLNSAEKNIIFWKLNQ